jgi:hypothetical protein
VYNIGVNREVAVAQLSIVDGAWQESPDHLAVVDEGGRGTLYLLVEVAGETEGRDALARELIETARREYASSRWSITFALTQAVREANNVFYRYNAEVAPESRRIAGMSAVVLREDELFVAQGGPGLVCRVHGNELTRYPETSPWFDPTDQIGDFTTPGTVPLGLRREYTPDLFHTTLQPGDTILLATRTLAHLLTNEELLDTMLDRHPDRIIDSLEEIAGAADLSAIVLQLATDTVLAPFPNERQVMVLESPATQSPAAPPAEPAVNEPSVPVAPVTVSSEFMTPLDDEPEEPVVPEPPVAVEEEPELEEDELAQEHAPTEEELARERAQAEEEEERRRIQEEQARVRRAHFVGGAYAAMAGTMAGIAAFFSRVEWNRLGTDTDRFLSLILRAFSRLIVFALHAFLPGTPDESTSKKGAPKLLKVQVTAWRLAALGFPIVLLLVGGSSWINYRTETRRQQDVQIALYLQQANTAIDAGKRVVTTDKAAARDAFQKAMALAQKAQDLNPTNPTARSVRYEAQDLLDGVSGISVLFFLPKFATFSDAKANPVRIIAHVPDIYIFDRGMQRIYRYVLNDTATMAAPASGDGVILKAGDKIAERTVGEMIDILWIDAGRLVALDRNGLFLQYDPIKSTWTARPANDGSQWSRVTLAASYLGNLYLLDPSKNLIWKYVASAEGVWSSAVTYLAPGVNVDLSSAVDMAIDGDLWVLRSDGSLWRFTAGKLTDFAIKELDTPLSKPVSLFTVQTMVGLYIADKGNQRIVQVDKVTGKFIRQFKPRGESRDTFDTLKEMTADETSKKFFFINGNQAYLANIPQ